MAPAPPDHKRKRGRPPGASKPEGDASRQEPRQQRRDGATTEQPAPRENPPAEQGQPRKRGRRARGPDPAARPEPEPEAEAAPRRARGRPRGADQAQASAADVAPAEDATIKKRGRGRPSLNKGEEAAPAVDDAPQKAESRARGRGRPPKGAAPEEGPTTESSKEGAALEGPSQDQAERAEAGPRRSHQEPAFSAKTSAPQDEAAGAAAAKKRKRATAEERPEEEANEEDPGRRRSNRERRSWTAEEVSSARMPNPEAGTTSRAGPPRQKAGRGAASSKGSSSKAQNQEEPPAAEPPKKRRRGRPSLDDEAPKEPVQPKRRARPSRQSEEQAVPPSDTAEPRRRGRPRTSDASAVEEVRQSTRAPRQRKGRPNPDQQPGMDAEKPKSRKRRSGQPQPADDEEEDEDVSAGPVAPGRLTGVAQKVSLSTIESKWAPLDSASMDVVTDIVADAQRTVLLQFRRSDRQTNAAAEALGMMSRRLLAKLKKGQPFPPPTSSASTRKAAGASHESDFHFERTVDASQALENTLDPLLHSIALLEREKKKEEAALERDYAALRTLDTNARAEVRSWRELARKSHVLAPEMKMEGEPETEGGSRLQLVKGDRDGVGNAFKDLEDDELVSLSRQIGSHMESMKSNLQQVDGVVPAIIKSKAALQGVLCQHLDPQQYSKVLLG